VKSGILFVVIILFFSFAASSQTFYWSRQATGKATEQALGVAVDKGNNAYLTGEAYSSTSVSFGAITLSITGIVGDFLVKYDSIGNVQWAKCATPSSTGDIIGNSVATDALNGVYETGYYNGSVTNGIYTLPAAGNQTMFLAKYDNNGNILWLTGAAPTSYSNGNCVTTDRNNNCYVSGMFYNTASFGSYTLTGSPMNMFLVKYGTGGNVIWAKAPSLASDSSSCRASNVATDGNNNVYVSGVFKDTVSFDAFTLRGRGFSVFLAKYDANGNVLWAINTGAFSNTAMAPLAVDRSNNVYVGGQFDNPSFNIGTYTLTDGDSAVGTNSFLAKYTSSGSVIWAEAAHYVSHKEIAGILIGAITTDICNNVYWAGTSVDSIWIGSYKATLPTKYQPDSVFDFAVKLDSMGNPLSGQVFPDRPITNYTNPVVGVATDSHARLLFCATVFDVMELGTDTLTNKRAGNAYISKLLLPGNICCKAMSYGILGDTMLCKGDSNMLVAYPAGQSYVWNNGATTDTITVKPGSSTTYTVSVTEGACTLISNIDMNVTPIPVANIAGASSICEGKSDSLTASGGNSFLWSTGATTSTITVMPTNTQTYSVSVSTNGCKDSTTKTIVVNPLPVTNVCCNTDIVIGQNTQLTAGGAVSYAWSPVTDLSCTSCPNPVASPNQTTTYILIATSDSGCVVTDTVRVEVGCGIVFIPDAFSPNKDGQNDILYVRSGCISSMDFMVFDRWGNKVFESQNISDGWDGTCKGVALNAGSFVYYLKASLRDGTTVEKKGNVALVR